MSPFASSSSERVVSFLSRDAEPPGNSLRARAYFAATRTPRYLLAECSAISSGVKTRMTRCSGCGVLDLLLEPLDEQPDLLSEILQSLSAHHFGVDDRFDTGDGSLEVVVHDHVLVLVHLLQLLERRLQPRGKLRCAFRLPRSKAFQQHLRRRRQDEDRHGLRKGPDELHRALHVDVHHDVLPRGHDSLDLGPQRPVEIAVDLRRLGEGPVLPLGDELRTGHEIVITSGHFGRTRCPGGARNGVTEVWPPGEQHPGDGGLSPSARSAENHREGAHSRFSTCSRIRSSSSLIWSTSATIAPSVPLLPVVFASRSISCSRKPSRFPTPSGCGAAIAARNAVMWPRNLDSSSATSRRSASRA